MPSRKGRYLYMWDFHLASKKHLSSSNGLRSTFIASKFKKSSGGACPHTPLAVFVHANYEPDSSNLMATDMPKLKGWNAGHMNKVAHVQWEGIGGGRQFYTNQ